MYKTVSMCTLKHARSLAEAEETPEQNPEDILCSILLVLRQGKSGSVQIQTVWAPALSECEIHSTCFLCVHDTLLLYVSILSSSSLSHNALNDTLFLLLASHLQHTYHISYVSLVFTYLPYIIYLILLLTSNHRIIL